MVYIIMAQMGNPEDWGWEEVDRTTDVKKAIEASKQGARVIEDHSNNGWMAEVIPGIAPEEDDFFELPF